MRFSNVILSTLFLASFWFFDGAKCIQNGKKVTKWQLYTKFEYVAALRVQFVKGRVSRCSGSILDDFTILTAAHCVYDHERKKFAMNIDLRVGTLENDQTIIGGRRREVDRFIMLKSYFEEKSSVTDIAMIKLKKSLKLNSLANRYTLKAVTLPPADFLTDHKKAVMSGYGAFAGKKVTYIDDKTGESKVRIDLSVDDKLRQNTVEIIPIDECANRKGRVDGLICSAISSKPGCAGDSGGPLVIRNGGVAQIIGVNVLGSKACDGDEFPTLYLRVSRNLDFIEKVKANQIQNSDDQYIVMTPGQSCPA